MDQQAQYLSSVHNQPSKKRQGTSRFESNDDSEDNDEDDTSDDGDDDSSSAAVAITSSKQGQKRKRPSFPKPTASSSSSKTASASRSKPTASSSGSKITSSSSSKTIRANASSSGLRTDGATVSPAMSKAVKANKATDASIISSKVKAAEANILSASPQQALSAGSKAPESSALSSKTKATKASAFISCTAPSASGQRTIGPFHKKRTRGILVSPLISRPLTGQVTSVSRVSTLGAGLTPAGRAGASDSMPTVSSHSSKFTSATATSVHDNDSDGSRSFAGHTAADDTSGSNSPLHTDNAQMACETDLLNMSPASSTGETASSASSVSSASSAVHDEQSRRGQKKRGSDTLDYTNGLDVLGFIDEQPNADELTQDIWHSRQITSGTKAELAPKAYKPSGNDAKFARIEKSYIPRGADGKFKYTSSCLDSGRAANRRSKADIDKTKKSPSSSLVYGSVGPIYSTNLEELLPQTASEFTEDDNEDARYQCPVPTCGKVFAAQDTLAALWKHCNDAAHQHALYEEGHLRCKMGCGKGFCNMLARLCHHADFHYRRPTQMLVYCHEPGYQRLVQMNENSRNSFDTRTIGQCQFSHARDVYFDPTITIRDGAGETGPHYQYGMPSGQLDGNANKTMHALLHSTHSDKVISKLDVSDTVSTKPPYDPVKCTTVSSGSIVITSMILSPSGDLFI
ncbi:hypothetical protein KCU93_g3433, partial [Aureobasidium melanogenum]